jgi:hypothetical protein
MKALRMANEGLAFGFELVALAVFAWWGASRGHGLTAVLYGVLVPVAAAAVWGLLAAPRAAMKAPLAIVVVVKVAFFGAAVAALVDLGHPVWGVVFGVAVAANTAAVTVSRRSVPPTELWGS